MGFEIFKGRNGKYYFRLISANGQVLLTSVAGYSSKLDVKHTSEKISQLVKDPSNFEIREDENGYIYFYIKSAKGKMIAISGLYRSKAGARNGISAVIKSAGTEPVLA